MKTKTMLTSLALAASLNVASTSLAQVNDMVVQANKPGAQIQATMYGIFFEDINYGADGGLYAEMVKNRSFEFGNPLQGWEISGNVKVMDDGPFDKSPHYLRLGYSGHRVIHTAIQNDGFFGVSYKKGETYRFSVWARCPKGDKVILEVQLVDEALDRNRHQVGSCKIKVEGAEWKKYECELRPEMTVEDGKLRIFLRNEKGEKPTSDLTVDVEHVSLFPADTWKERTGGMRKDLVQALYDLHPGVFRFPGGCIVEGTNLADRYQWKNTVGPVENRPLNLNRWQYEFDYRYYPDYYQSYGIGFFEYFQLAEDLGAAPLPVLNCGMTCQFENDIKDEAKYHVAVEDLDPYIQDAVDLVEFANGGVDTKWGKVRADMGHPEPFGLEFIAIGNEQWDYQDNPAYTKRLVRFIEVLRKKCPEIKIIGTTGPNSEGASFDILQSRMKQLGVDLYDEHFYRNEDWFLGKATDRDGNIIKGCGATRYDSYDRKGPKVFAGEYACHGRGKYADGKEKKCNHFETSLYEAAFMTGFERNADVVYMATYAPLFAHIKGWQWCPDLIWFDNMRSMKSCSYYVQQLYSHYKGTNVLSLTMNKKPVAGSEGQNGLYASAVANKETGEIYVKIVNTGDTPQPVNLTFKGIKALLSGKLITLHSDNLDAENTLDNPNVVTPQEKAIEVSGNTLSTDIPAKTFCVYVLKR